MRKLINTIHQGDHVLKIYESTYKLRGEVWYKDSKEKVSFADFYGKDRSEYRVKEYFGFPESSSV